MNNIWAKDFYEIIPILTEREDILERVIELIQSEPVLGKALEGPNRECNFKYILMDLINQKINLNQSYNYVETAMGTNGSPYIGNNRVFSKGWGERLIRTNLSRLYNQAVLNLILESGETKCFIPHSIHEKSTSKCSQYAGQTYDAQTLLNNLLDIYSKGNYGNKGLKIPEHPYCTHVITPVI